MKTIGEIKEEFSAAQEADWSAICQTYETDPRSGVQKLVQQYRKKLDALEKEKLRMEQMMQFEHKYEHLGYLCGIDEGLTKDILETSIDLLGFSAPDRM